MPKYIDIENFSQMVYENFGRDGEYDYRDLIRILREQPTADVKEVVRGEWEIQNKSKFNYDKCSVCGFNKPSFLEFRKYDFCPNCGADMRGEIRNGKI